MPLLHYEQAGNVVCTIDAKKLARRVATFLNNQVPSVANAPTDANFDAYINGLRSAVNASSVDVSVKNALGACLEVIKALCTIGGPPKQP